MPLRIDSDIAESIQCAVYYCAGAARSAYGNVQHRVHGWVSWLKWQFIVTDTDDKGDTIN
jgi:hypothetical protein